MDIGMLKQTMKEQGITNEELAEKIGRDPSTFYRKMKRNGLTFTVEEAELIAKALNIPRRKATTIFFGE